MTIKWWHFAIIFCVTLLILGLYFFLVLKCYPNLAERGQFGDMFGAVSSLFTACGFGALLLTIWQQNKEAIERDKEVEEERKVLIKNADAMTKSSEALAKQLQVMTISTKLSALPNLIDSTASELETRFKNNLRDNNVTNIRHLRADSIAHIILNAKEHLSAGDEIRDKVDEHANLDNFTVIQRQAILITANRNKFVAFIEELEHLKKYKEDAKRLYDLV